MVMKTLSGVVFDCDGTIADTESLSELVWTDALARYGYTTTVEDFRQVIGHPFPQNWDYFSARADLGERTSFREQLRERYLELLEHELMPYPDAVDTIKTLYANGVPIAVASSSRRWHVERVLQLSGVAEMITAVVGADDVDVHKPQPEPYLAAVRMLDADSTRVTAVEDTAVGIASAVGAGLFTVGVARRHTRQEDLAQAHRVVTAITYEALVDDRKS